MCKFYLSAEGGTLLYKDADKTSDKKCTRCLVRVEAFKDMSMVT
jgi:hypothetical protein